MYLNMYINNELYKFLASILVTDADMTFYDFCTLLAFRSTAVVLCNYNENTFMCSQVVCTRAAACKYVCHIVYMQRVSWCVSGLK